MRTLSFVCATVAVAAVGTMSFGQVVSPPYSTEYVAVSLGSVVNVPGSYGGLTFLNPNTLLLAGAANSGSGSLWTAAVIRDGATSHILGFGAATKYADAPQNDGGLVIAPNGTILYTGYPNNTLYQIKPGSTVPDKLTSLDGLVNSSVGTLTFVPAGQPGAGQLKVASYNGNDFRTLTIVPDGTGTYDITGSSATMPLAGGPEGLVYVPTGSPLFPDPTLLVSEYGLGTVSAYDVDSNGDPITATRRTFLTGLTGAEGSVIDPVTGDFFFSTFGGGNQIVRVSGFAAVPEPGALAAVAPLGWMLRRRR